MIRLRGAGLVAALVLLTSATFAGPATARSLKHKPKSPPPVVLRPRFHPFATGVTNLFADGHYTVVLTATGGARLTDDRTGQSVVVAPPPGCYLDSNVANYSGGSGGGPTGPLGGGWLMFACKLQTEYDLYRVADGTWRLITPDRGRLYAYNDACGGIAVADGCFTGPTAIGAHWIQFEVDCGYHCPSTVAFLNIGTGQVQGSPAGWQPGGTVIPDLSSPTLVAKLCSPLRVPLGPWEQLISSSPPPGNLRFYGPFAIAGGFHGPANDPASAFSAVLERCGTRLQQPLGTLPPFANSHVVMRTDSSSNVVKGLFLPSLRPLRVVLPHGEVVAALSSRTLYVTNHHGTLLATASPTAPRLAAPRRPAP